MRLIELRIVLAMIEFIEKIGCGESRTSFAVPKLKLI